MQVHEPRFKVLALSPYHLDAERIWRTHLQIVDRATLDSAMAQMQIRFNLPLDACLCPQTGLEFRFDELKALHPDGIAKSNVYLSELLQAKEFIHNARMQGAVETQIRQGLRQWPDLPAIDIETDALSTKVSPAPADSRLDNILRCSWIGEIP